MIKVRREKVNWFKVLIDQHNIVFDEYFFNLIGKLHRGKRISNQRAAYSTLKHFYSTTTIADLKRKLGI